MRSVRLFGKSIPLLAIVAIAMTAGMASAVLLDYYGRITATVNVKQSVLVDGKDYLQINTHSGDTVAGNTIRDGPHTLLNQADIPVTVTLETAQSGDGTPNNNVVGITTTYTTTVTESSSYEDYMVDSQMLVTLKVDGLTLNELLDMGLEYTVNIINNPLYYPNINIWVTNDSTTRVINGWGADAEIAIGQNTVTFSQIMDKTRGYGASSRTTLNPPNIKQYDNVVDLISDYGTWQVTKVEVRAQAGAAGGQVIRPVQFKAAGTTINIPNSYSITSLTLQPGELLNFYIVNEFDATLVPGTYTITTTVVPA